MADWFRQVSARAGEQTSLSVLLARLERQVVRARRFRLYRSLRRRPTEVLEPRLLLSSPQIKVESQHDGQYWSIRFVNMPDGVSIGTADPDPNDSLPQDCLYYADTNGKHFDIDWGDQNRSGYFDLADVVNNPVTKPLYISDLDGTDTFEFDNFNTYGRSFYVLQEHSQLNDVDDPPVVIEEHNNYLAEPNIGSKILQVSGIIDTNVKPGTQAVASAGNIGLFSNQQVTIGNANGSAQNTGLKGREITVATWALGTLSARKPEVTVTHATIDGADVSLTAYSRDLDFKKQVVQLDFKQIAVTVEDSTVTAKGAVTISAIQDDSIGFGDGNYNYAASQMISGLKGWLGTIPSPADGGGWRTIFNGENANSWFKFVNVFNFGLRAAESKVSLDGATIQADGAVSVGSTANVATSLTSIQTKDFDNYFWAVVLAISKSTAATDVTDTTITSWNDSVSITSYASAKASSMARALAGYRPNVQPAPPGDANPPVPTEFKSNAATKTISVAISWTDLTSQTTVDENSKISAGTWASITSDGTVSNNSTTKSRSFNDGSLGLSISLGIDSSTVQTTVKGIVQSGISLHSATPPVIRQSLVDATAASLLPTPSDTDFLPLHVNPGESLPFQPGDWVSNLLDPNSPLPEIGPVAGASSLTAGDSYYVVDTANNQLQLALGPSLDLNLPRDDSQGQPTVIPLSTRQTLSVQVTRAADDTLDPATPNRPGPGYLYLPDHFLTTGQLVRYAHLDLPPDDLTAASTPLSIPYANWAPSEPRNTTDEEDALGMNPDGTWQAVAGSTNRGYVLFKVDGTYTYRPDPLSFPDARVDASNNGGFVAFPTDAASNAAILAAAAGNPIWLNASDSVEEGVWDAVDTTRFFTADSTPASTPYAHWATDPAQVNDPQKDLLVMNADGTWQAVPATDGARHGYVLYKSDQTYTYVPGPFTRPDADADATRRGGLCRFPKMPPTTRPSRPRRRATPSGSTPRTVPRRGSGPSGTALRSTRRLVG